MHKLNWMGSANMMTEKHPIATFTIRHQLSLMPSILAHF